MTVLLSLEQRRKSKAEKKVIKTIIYNAYPIIFLVQEQLHKRNNHCRALLGLVVGGDTSTLRQIKKNEREKRKQMTPKETT